MSQSSPKTENPSALQEFVVEFTTCWERLPHKFFFFTLLAAWLLLFQFYGNGTFGYVDTASLLYWMKNSYSNSMSDGQDAHGLIVPPAVLLLFWMKRKELFALPVKLWRPGLAIIIFALALHVFGYLIQQPRVSIVALFLGIYGLMGLTWGSAWLKESFFPFCLFVFCIPISAISQGITFPLRLLVSKIVWIITHVLIGMPVMRVGTQLFNEDHTYAYDVAAACSGIQSLLAIVGLNTVVAFMQMKSWWRRGIMISSAIPLAILSNVTRLLMVIITAQSIDRDAGNYVHDNAFFSMIPYVPAIVGAVMVSRWLEEKPEKDSLEPSEPTETKEANA